MVTATTADGTPLRMNTTATTAAGALAHVLLDALEDPLLKETQLLLLLLADVLLLQRKVNRQAACAGDFI